MYIDNSDFTKAIRIKYASKSLAMFLMATNCSFRYNCGVYIIENCAAVADFRRFCEENGADVKDMKYWRMDVVLTNNEIENLEP